MTTNEAHEVQLKPRNLQTLLSLKTYQGMSDEEIDSIIKFRVENAREDEITRAQQAAIITRMNEDLDASIKATQESNNILKEILKQPLELIKINEQTQVSKD